MHATLSPSKTHSSSHHAFHFATTTTQLPSNQLIDRSIPSSHFSSQTTAAKRLIDTMQGVKGGGEPPMPDAKELESESAKQMRRAGFDRAQAEDWQKKGVMEKIQATTSHIKDAAAEKMDQLAGAAATTTSTTK